MLIIDKFITIFTNSDRTLIFEAETSRTISVNRVLPRNVNEQNKARLHRRTNLTYCYPLLRKIDRTET